ncbi:MAG: lytic transglycosylase domain-containing protein [Alphaproteobacteria bacterium]|nr:lytic transglycosylase domain-containing protein [Alphaproteobacteria bacterium]
MTHEAILALALTCAPQVHPQTVLHLVKHESGNNPYAIGINGPFRLSRQPRDMTEAVITAKYLLSAGHSIDMGLAMINHKNLKRLSLTVESVFDACENLKGMQSVLLESYQRAVKKHGPGGRSLAHALSEYNTGHPNRGIDNGYVEKVVTVRVPGIDFQKSRSEKLGADPN